MDCAKRRSRVPSRAQNGFSILEMVIVGAIIAIMIGVAIMSLPTQRRVLAVDFSGAQLVDVLRFANQRSLSERQVMRVEITPSTNTVPGKIEVVDQNTLAAGTADDAVVRSETLVPKGEVGILTEPTTTIPLPPAPFNFLQPTFVNNKFILYFTPDGQTTNEAGTTPQSLSLVYYTPGSGGDPDPGLTRALTLFGPTSSVRTWTYDIGTNSFKEM